MNKFIFHERMISMKKQTTALLTAAMLLTTLCGTASMHTGAAESLVLVRDADGSISLITEEDENYVFSNPRLDYVYDKVWEGEHGECMYHGQNTGTGFWYAVTTSGGMPLFYTLPGDSRPHYIRSTELVPGDEEFPQDGEALLAAHGEGARLFRFNFDGYTFMNDEYLLEQDCASVLDVYQAIFISDGECVWDGTFITEFPVSEDFWKMYSDENGRIPSQDMIVSSCIGREYGDRVKELLDEREAWLQAYSQWVDTVDYDALTPEERAASLQAAGIQSDWEITRKAILLGKELDALAEQYYRDHGGENVLPYLKGTDIRFSMREVTHSYGYKDIWDSMGDFNKDGSFNAADASYVLTVSAGNGVEKEKITYVDFNLDGKCNASDAADMLCFLADKGAGEQVTVKEYLQKLSESHMS